MQGYGKQTRLCIIIKNRPLETKAALKERRSEDREIGRTGKKKNREIGIEKAEKQENREARKQESKKAREQESKRAREQESKRARKQESKKAREQEDREVSLEETWDSYHYSIYILKGI
ncbi:MAG: hypothetical protein AB3K77_01930 [Methanosarcinaceae archaeon]